MMSDTIKILGVLLAVILLPKLIIAIGIYLVVIPILYGLCSCFFGSGTSDHRENRSSGKTNWEGTGNPHL